MIVWCCDLTEQQLPLQFMQQCCLSIASTTSSVQVKSSQVKSSQVKPSQAKRINMSEATPSSSKRLRACRLNRCASSLLNKTFHHPEKMQPPSPSLKLPLHPHPPLKLPLAVHIICIWIQHPTYFPIFLVSSVRVHSLFRNLLRVSP